MDSLPEEIYAVAAVREIDRTAIEAGGIPGYTLMTRAAEFTQQLAVDRFPTAQQWQILCGAGNNAGDGYVIARLAAAAGIKVSVLALSDPQLLRGDAATAYLDFTAAGGTVLPWSGKLDPAATVLVDALLGSGLQREVAGDYAAAVAALNAAAAPVVAVDIPTGLHGDTGEVMGCAVSATVTATYVGLKAGLFLGRGPDLSGQIYYSDLGIEPSCFSQQQPVLRRIRRRWLRQQLPPRARTANKGNFGHVLLISGGAGMPGAAVLAGTAALRAGAGKVSVATWPGHAVELVSERPELMVSGVHDAPDLEAGFAGTNILAIGPGLGQSPWAEQLLGWAQQQSAPAVWDADALNWLAAHPHRDPSRVITPHPGEAGRLLGCSSADIQADRLAAARALQARYGGVVILKGAGTLVKGEASTVWISTRGNPGMAAPGMGDVLTGVVAALLAQGLEPLTAARAAVEIHAQAGDIAARQGERGMLASDLLAPIREQVNPGTGE